MPAEAGERQGLQSGIGPAFAPEWPCYASPFAQRTWGHSGLISGGQNDWLHKLMLRHRQDELP